MDDATPGPQRMRYSFESRCRAVAAMVAGLRPGVAAQAVMTDNGSVYRSHAWRRHCAARGLRHLRTRPSHPPHRWQGRTLHPAPAAELGLCLRLSLKRPPHAGPHRLAAVV